MTSLIGDRTIIKTYDALGRRSAWTAYTTNRNHGWHNEIEWNKESNQSYLYDSLSFNVLAELKDTQFTVDTHGRTHRRTSRYQWQPLSEYLYKFDYIYEALYFLLILLTMIYDLRGVAMHDVIVIGMGPAGMAVSAMAVKLGLSVLGIEKNKIGGECLNCGCIPSKALLKAGEMRKVIENLEHFGIKPAEKPDVADPLAVVREKVETINGPKTMKTFEKVDLVLASGSAEFLNAHTVKVGDKEYRGKKIFIATGTEPMIPPVPGLDKVDVLTNVNLFEQQNIPKSLMIIGGGAIGTEMAQAFSRLGSKVVLAHMDPHLIPAGDREAGKLLQKTFEDEGIEVYNSTRIEKVEKVGDMITTYTDKGSFTTERILVAAGRRAVLDGLKLEAAGVRYSKKGIEVNKKLQTSQSHIYAVGDCNGVSLFSHAAMHQGMLALMNALNPTPFKKFKYDAYPVPWSVFTKPEIAQVGLTEEQAAKQGLDVKLVQAKYADYGRTIADGQPEGFVKVLTNKKGKIYGATIVGESASELIHEWTMAIQYKLSLFDIMMMQHSFPTISLMNKRVAENWMMDMVDKPLIQKWARRLI